VCRLCTWARVSRCHKADDGSHNAERTKDHRIVSRRIEFDAEDALDERDRVPYDAMHLRRAP